jgi:hypothetical protein
MKKKTSFIHVYGGNWDLILFRNKKEGIGISNAKSI